MLTKHDHVSLNDKDTVVEMCHGSVNTAVWIDTDCNGYGVTKWYDVMALPS